MWKKLAVAVLVLIAAVLVYATTRPDHFRVTRTTLIQAPPDKVFALIDDFHQWTLWSPWERMDPDLKRSYSGPAAGVGAAYAWEGHKTGAGRMEIVSTSPAAHIQIQLDFLQPFEAHNTAAFTLQPQGGATQVTWAMYGPSPYVSKLMGIFFSMDQIVGKDFEAGLANMKQAAEQPAAALTPGPGPGP